MVSSEDDRNTSADSAGDESQHPAVVTGFMVPLESANLSEARLDLDDIYPYHTDLTVLS